MPIARFQLEDGRVARFEVPEGTSPEQAQVMMTEHFSTPKVAPQPAPQPEQSAKSTYGDFARTLNDSLKAASKATSGQSQLGRGFQDVLDSAALGSAWARDKLGGNGNYDAVKADVDAINKNYEQTVPNATGMRLVSNIAATSPVGGVFGKIAEGLKASPALVNALRSSGLSTGAAPIGGIAKASDLALRTAAGGIVGATGGAMINPEDALFAGGVGAAMPAGFKALGAAGGAVGNAIAPKMKDTVRELADKAKSLGINVPADRLTDSKILNAFGSSLEYVPFSGRSSTLKEMDSQLMKATSKLIGQDTDNMAVAIRNAKKDLSAKFDDTLKNNTVKVDDTLLSSLASNEKKAYDELGDSPAFRPIKNQINQILEMGKTGEINGQAAYNIKKDLDRLANGSGNEAFHAKQLRESLMDALDRSLGAEKAAAFKEARTQYGNMLDLAPLVQNGAEGKISAARLGNLKDIRDPRLKDVADIAAQFVKPRDSTHSAMQRVGMGLTGLAAGGGTLMGMGLPIAAGMSAGRGANSLLNSNTARSYLMREAGQTPQNEQLANLLRQTLPLTYRATPAIAAQ
jgi:hypothetical protein